MLINCESVKAEWKTIFKSPRREIRINIDSRQGEQIIASYELYEIGFLTDSEYIDDGILRLRAKGTGTFCDGEPKYNYLAVYNNYYEGELGDYIFLGAEADYQTLYYTQMNSVTIRHFLCNTLNPNYLKIGMTMEQAKKLLYQGGFKIVEYDEEGATNYKHSICDDPNKYCVVHGNHEFDIIVFHNQKTRVTISLWFFENLLQEVSWG